MDRPGVFYHVTRPPWRPGQPLVCRNRLIELGIRSKDDWQHPNTPVGTDGDTISLHESLSNARDPYARLGETILRVKIPSAELSKLRSDSDDYPCYPGEIPAAWLEVVAESEPNWGPPKVGL